jgi:uncharacterized protein (TIGR03067 family)
MNSMVLALALLVAAPGPKDPPKKEPPSIVGEWACTECIAGGRPFPGEMLPMIGIRFMADGKFKFRFGLEEGTGTFTTDPSKDPAEVNYTSDKSGKGNHGIYKIEKDVLILCATEGGGQRPTKFESPAGTRIMLLKYTRVEKKKD